MPRHKPPPVNIDPHEVTINVYAFGGSKPIVAWIEAGFLNTIVGCPSFRVTIELGPPTPLDPECDKLRKAAEIVVRKGYRNAWILHSDGTRTKLQTL